MLCHLSAFRHTSEEYSLDFAFILDQARCRVREHLVMQSMDRMEIKQALIQQSMTLMFAAQRRPSLTAILATKRLRDTADHPHDSFKAFCRSARLALNCSHRVKLVAYFLVCLPDHPHSTAEISRVMGEGHTATDMVIIAPDLHALREVVTGTRHSGVACEEVRQFKEACISGSTIQHAGRGVLWTSVLQLYIASYCRPAVAKDLWSHIIAMHMNTASSDASWLHTSASSEVEGRIAAFTQQRLMALPAVINLMLQS